MPAQYDYTGRYPDGRQLEVSAPTNRRTYAFVARDDQHRWRVVRTLSQGDLDDTRTPGPIRGVVEVVEISCVNPSAPRMELDVSAPPSWRERVNRILRDGIVRTHHWPAWAAAMAGVTVILGAGLGIMKVLLFLGAWESVACFVTCISVAGLWWCTLCLLFGAARRGR